MVSLRNASPVAIVISIIAVFYIFMLYEGMVFPLLSNSEYIIERNIRSENKYSESGQELVDLSEDGKIGSEVEAINIVHLKGLAHRGVWMILLDSQLENVLFVRRSQYTVTCKNAWSLFGEHTQDGETYQEAALRGVREELALHESDFSLVSDLSPSPELLNIVYTDSGRIDKQWTSAFFFVLKNNHVFPENAEATGYLWIPIHASSHWITQCNSYRCRSCTDIQSISVTKNGQETSYRSMGQVIAEKMDALLIKVAALAKQKEALVARNISLGKILPDDDALPHVMHHDDLVTDGESKILTTEHARRRLGESSADKCADIWRKEELVGRCFGLKSLSEYKDGKVEVPDAVATSEDCKRLCCKLGSNCVTWQFWELSKECKLGGPVRFGTEGADNDNWCEPNAPRHWNGRVLLSRHENVESSAENKPKKPYKCQWGEALQTQCFGLGPEKTTFNPHEMSHFTGREDKSVGGKLARKHCAASCCNDPGCTHWQELPDRGCFHNNNQTPSISCETYKGTFTGGRKCVKQFCGDHETTTSMSWIPPFRSNWGC